jgi:hypothetical protein
VDLNSRSFYSITGIFWISLGCEVPLDIEDINYKHQAVFWCQLNPENEILVQLQKDFSTLDQNIGFQRIEGANIFLYEDDKYIGEVNPSVGELGSSPGFYNLAYKPKQNSTYTFQVNHPEYPQLQVSDKVPLKKSNLILKSLTQSYQNNSDGSITGYIDFIIEMLAADEGQNFYELGFSNYFYYYSDFPGTEDSVYYSPNLFPAIAQTDIFEDNIDKWFLTDELFNNSSIDIKMNGELRLQASVVENLVSHGIRIRFRQVSQAYYQYYLTAELQKYLSGDPFAEPVQVFSNVEGGGGFLGSYVEEIIDVPLENPK